jgi:hypothetical protein
LAVTVRAVMASPAGLAVPYSGRAIVTGGPKLSGAVPAIETMPTS